MTVRAELTPPILILSLDRPKANAFDQAQLDALASAVEEAEAVDGARALVIRATQETRTARAPSTGVRPFRWARRIRALDGLAHATLDRIAGFPVPVIAALQRPAVGGGFELALACHLRVMGRDAHLSLPEIHRGYLPSWAGLERLVPLVGLGLAADLVLTGRRVRRTKRWREGWSTQVADGHRAPLRAGAGQGRSRKLPPLAVRAAMGQLKGASGAATVETRCARARSPTSSG